MHPVAGVRTMDINYMIGSTFLGIYATNRALHAYQFYFEPNGVMQQEMLPFVQAFGLPGKNSWVLSPEQLHDARVLAGREEGEGARGNPAWEGHGGHYQGDAAWENFGYQQPPQYQQQQWQQPEPQPRHNYVPYDQYQTLVHHVGNVESTLQDVNSNIDTLS
jgi:hypothetical protein